MQLGSLVSWIAVIPGSASAVIAFYQARKSRTAAHDAREALGAAIRPVFAFGWEPGAGAQPEFLSVTASNTGQFDAVDVELWASIEGHSSQSKATALRMSGRVPGTLGGEPGLVVADAIRMSEIDDEKVISVTARFADERGIQRWEQRGRILVSRTADGAVPTIVSKEYDQGKPVKYSKA